MESNSKAPAFEMNGKEDKNSPSEKVSFQLVLEILQKHTKFKFRMFMCRSHF